MNIFIMILAFLFMAGYYFIGSPSQTVTKHTLDYAITQTDLKSIAECAASSQTAYIKGFDFMDDCITNYNISTSFVCLDNKMSITKCEIIRNKKPEYSFMITSTEAINEAYYNNMLEIIEDYYPDSGTFGIMMDDFILSGTGAGKKAVPAALIKNLELSKGQLIYMTQYEIPDIETEFIKPVFEDIYCMPGTIKNYRFGRWQCTPENEKTNCSGDNIWNSDTQECIPDDSRKPLCDSSQAAVMVDDIWECIDPFLDKKCPQGMMAQLNYSDLEWECIEDPSVASRPKNASQQKDIQPKEK